MRSGNVVARLLTSSLATSWMDEVRAYPGGLKDREEGRHQACSQQAVHWGLRSHQG